MDKKTPLFRKIFKKFGIFSASLGRPLESVENVFRKFMAIFKNLRKNLENLRTSSKIVELLAKFRKSSENDIVTSKDMGSTPMSGCSQYAFYEPCILR